MGGSTTCELDDTARGIVAVRRLAGRVAATASRLSALRPFDAARVATLDAAAPDRIDAWAWQFSMLARHLRNGVWPGIAAFEELLDPADLSTEELTRLMERLGLLADAAGYRSAAATGEAIIAIVAAEAGTAARLLEESLAAAPLLLDCVDRAEAWATRRRLTPPASP